MYPVLGKCPHCDSNLIVTRLHCRSCGSSMEGQFSLGPFHKLSPEQLRFAEIFIKCEGKITRVEEELGISYPTVRNRLTDLIRGLGYDVREDIEASQESRKVVLNRLADGEITPEEAVELLKKP